MRAHMIERTAEELTNFVVPAGVLVFVKGETGFVVGDGETLFSDSVIIVPPTDPIGVPGTIDLQALTRPSWWSGENRWDEAGQYLEADPLGNSTQGYAMAHELFTFDPVKSYKMTFVVTTEATMSAQGKMTVYSCPADGDIDSSNWFPLVWDGTDPQFLVVWPTNISTPTEFEFMLGPGMAGWDQNVEHADGYEPSFFLEYPGGLHIHSLRVIELLGDS